MYLPVSRFEPRYSLFLSQCVNHKTTVAFKLVLSPQVVPQINKGTIGKANDSIGKDFSEDHWKTVVEYLEHLKTKQQDEEQIENNKDEWNRLARILDRLFFWIYLTYFIMFFFVVMSVKWGST